MLKSVAEVEKKLDELKSILHNPDKFERMRNRQKVWLLFDELFNQAEANIWPVINRKGFHGKSNSADKEIALSEALDETIDIMFLQLGAGHKDLELNLQEDDSFENYILRILRKRNFYLKLRRKQTDHTYKDENGTNKRLLVSVASLDANQDDDNSDEFSFMTEVADEDAPVDELANAHRGLEKLNTKERTVVILLAAPRMSLAEFAHMLKGPDVDPAEVSEMVNRVMPYVDDDGFISLSKKEVAAVMDCSQPTSKKLFERAVKRLTA